MATRERPADRGARLAARALIALGEDLRLARVSAGLSQATTGKAVRAHHSTVGRIERGQMPGVSIDLLGRLCAVFGLDLTIRAYPSGDPIRDAAHIALLERLRARLPAHARWRSEVPLPRLGDLRAWDAMVDIAAGQTAIEAETTLANIQALERRLGQKRRDGGVDRMILLVANTVANRRALALAREQLRGDFPLDSREILAAFTAGRQPEQSGIVVL